MTNRAFFSDTVERFLDRNSDEIIGRLASASPFADEKSQKDSWREQIRVLRDVLESGEGFRGQGKVYFEYSVPRMGKRIDVVLVLRHVVFVLEFKVGETEFTAHAVDQVLDYALDLKNFHETSHGRLIAPVLIATRAPKPAEDRATVEASLYGDDVLPPLFANAETLPALIRRVVAFCEGPSIDAAEWEAGRYSPTPTIIEAAIALYGGHGVAEISRSDAGATNLTKTSEAIDRIIREAKAGSHKAICFVTGVPGAGKTLVGLNTATQHAQQNRGEADQHSVFLSGNGPLVAILREALARDKVQREQERGRRCRIGKSRSEVKAFIQNVHHFRDECLIDRSRPPIDHVAVFDEAQRAWDHKQTESFMRRKKDVPDFAHSEPEFLISCMDRHKDWAVIVCLVGGGQEINTGEAGIGEWVDSILRSFGGWRVHISPHLHDSEYAAGRVLAKLGDYPHLHCNADLHLGVSMRSFRAENVSAFVKHLLDLNKAEAQRTLAEIGDRYPIVLMRDVGKAKAWLRAKARGSERYGLVVSSQAQRLRPHAIDVRSPMDPIHWFLDGKEDVRSSYYLEDVATEFHVQGLELDWSCVVWDGDFRYSPGGWQHHSFVGNRWNRVRNSENQTHLKNAYRVLLTRARQGMVIVVPEGDESDPTRSRDYYDSTWEYLKSIVSSD